MERIEIEFDENGFPILPKIEHPQAWVKFDENGVMEEATVEELDGYEKAPEGFEVGASACKLVDGEIVMCEIDETYEYHKERGGNGSVMTVEESLRYLNNTNWYIIRKVEHGKDLPEKVVAKRAEALAIIRGE